MTEQIQLFDTPVEDNNFNILSPTPPFIWPEPRVIEKMCSYENRPPFASLAASSCSMIGIVSSLTVQGVNVIESWLVQNDDFKANLVVTVYPTCATRQTDLSCLLDLVSRTQGRLDVHVLPLESVTDRTTNTLCFLALDKEVVHMVTGPSEGLGLGPWREGQINFVFRANPVQVESFKRYFDWLWTRSVTIASPGVLRIPDLILPEGTEEGDRMWQDYLHECSASVDATLTEQAHINPETGKVTILKENGEPIPPATEEFGFKGLDPLSEFVAGIYEKGSLVSIDKQSRIPPLDAPLDPRLFGDASELHQGSVTRKVNMRVSIIDERTLKAIEKRRQGVRALLTAFTFGLADNMRWMPDTARELFESELTRLNEEGNKLIGDLLQGNVDTFVEGRRATLVKDINDMYEALGRQGKATEDVITKVMENIKSRLKKALSADFIPKLSYSAISFIQTNNAFASPWGQAYSLLRDIAVFPRKAITDSFFFRGLKVPEDDMLDAMNVADDALFTDIRSRGIKIRCKAELDLLARIEAVPMDARDRCELVYRIITGESVDSVDELLRKKVNA